MSETNRRTSEQQARMWRRHRLLTALSWGTFVLAFLGFFTIWVKVSHTSSSPSASMPSTGAGIASGGGAAQGTNPYPSDGSGGVFQGSSPYTGGTQGSLFGDSGGAGGAGIGQQAPDFGSAAS
ncbi:hypothetical protein JI721_03730 [Alicyclobacillus cycloheptanicus]|uniref:Uncharacterized protein n=1 Tax=Alicyclobacillus cycloheptanicus TaxID=1457 RepID=A0ABT9XI18_9BACL|nr:hypothetical protein [Alicyclobacillus cycloheptanicus]MDQ0189755.1 hypothetical protein [Alicyclobacillus cycloheptanicus]WDM01959.1 hypothetical protein JI721_03730 [Alicyclobacillus cycloheptanicus]